MKCIHGANKDSCRVCYRLQQPQQIYYYEDTRVYRDGIPLVPTRTQKFCKRHKSIWGKESWWCLWALWMEKVEVCEEEYLEVEL